MKRSFGYLVGRASFYRDRGAGWVDGFRSSLQLGVILSGVAFGFRFTENPWLAGVLGAVTAIGLEVLKLAWGLLDWRIGAMNHHQQATGVETNPAQKYQLLLLDEMAKRLGVTPEWITNKRKTLGIKE